MNDDYYTALATLQRRLARAYYVKNTSPIPAEVAQALRTIEVIEQGITKLLQTLEKTDDR